MKLHFIPLIIALGFVGCKQVNNEEIEKPNILFCIMDDAGMHFSAYGYDWVQTPAFDRLADNGVLFSNAYTPNAKCAPSRSSVLTGRNSWQLEQAANHVLNFPSKFKTFPEVMREHGYLTASTGKVWGPGDPGKVNGKKRLFIDQEFGDIKMKPWAKGMSNEDYASNFEAFLNTVEDGKPWFFWYGAREPHRRYEYGAGNRVKNKQISDIDSVPAFWPDNEVVRNDMLDYALEIEYADWHLGRMIEMLEARGLLENTLIIQTSDHGMPFPRGKAQEYEYSNHVPMAAMWPKGIKKPGRTVKDMVSFIDLAKTFLELAGIPFEESGMYSSPGKSLTDIFYSEKEGQVNPDRDIVLIGKERHDYSRPQNQGFPIRGIVSDGYLYLYNYKIDRWPAGNPEIGYLDIDGSPTKTEILNLFRSGENDFYWKLSMGKRETNEEFFNISKDDECMINLADDHEYAEVKAKMKGRMEELLKQQEDPRMFGKGDIFDTYDFSNDKGWNYYDRFMAGEFTMKDAGWVNPSDKEEKIIE